MAIAITWPGFNDLGRSVTPVFLLMDYFSTERPRSLNPEKAIAMAICSIIVQFIT